MEPITYLIITNIIIIVLNLIFIITKTYFGQWIASVFNIKTHKKQKLNEYQLKRYDDTVEKIENIMTKNLKSEYKDLNLIYSKFLIGAPDNVLNKFLKLTNGNFDKTQRNALYYYIRKELYPNTKIKFEKIENKFFDEKKSTK